MTAAFHPQSVFLECIRRGCEVDKAQSSGQLRTLHPPLCHGGCGFQRRATSDPAPRWWSTFFAVVILSMCSVVGEAAFTPQIYTNAAGQSMPYQLLKPETLSPQALYPLVLFFHGAGERGTDNKKQLIHGTSLFLRNDARQAFPCFVLAPQCPEEQQWVNMPWGTDAGERPAEPSKAMALALQILDKIIQEYPVDTNRVYVTGLSMGGYGTWDCVTRFPQRFAAAIPICGGGDERTITAEVAQVPVWAFHSDDDSTVKVIRTRHMIESMTQAGGHPKYTQYTGLGHNSWDNAYSEPDLLSWMFAQRLDQRAAAMKPSHNPAPQPK